MSGRTRVKSLAQSVKELFDNERTISAFTLYDVAAYHWRAQKVTMSQVEHVAAKLLKVRQYLEDHDDITFIPFTDYYFQHHYGKHQPNGNGEARLCIAGLGIGQRTAGIRKLRIGHGNDTMMQLWLDKLIKTGGGSYQRVVNRVLLGFRLGALTEIRARVALEAAYKKSLPHDRVSFGKLLPAKRRVAIERQLELLPPNGQE